MHCITIKCMWMITQISQKYAWLLFVWTMFCFAMIVRSLKSSGVSGKRCVAAWKAGRPVCFEGRTDRPSQFITDLY